MSSPGLGGPLALLRRPAAAFVGPFVVFMVMLMAAPYWPTGLGGQALRVVVLTAAIFVLSRKVIDLRPTAPLTSVALGVAVFVVWIGPDLLWPEYRSHWLFQNSITGELARSIPEQFRTNIWVLAFRTFRAVILVPIIEELFWRGWMMRWLIAKDFRTIPLGTYSAQSFWITAVLFGSVHGPYWEVGLLAGIAYNWWMVRTKRLGDCILAHAVTNAVLSAYVMAAGKWEYWM